MKTIKKASLLFASLALVLGAGLVGNSDTKEVKAEDAIISAGENASTAEVKLSDGTTISAMKAGTSKKMGTLKVAIPQGATKLSFYAVAWNKSSSPTIDILDDKSSNVASLSIKADTGIKNNSPFTLSTSDVSTFLVTTSLSDVTTDTTYTLTSTVRFVVWNATVELGVSKSVKSLESSGKLKKTAYQVGETFDPNGLTITANYDDGTSVDVTSKVTWSEITSGATSVTGSYGGKEIVIEGIKTLEYVLSIVADKTSAQVSDEGKFSYTFKDSSGKDITAGYVEWKSSNADVIMVDTNTGAWLAMGLGSATITLNVMDSNTNIYEDSIDFVVKVEPVISEVTIASLMEKTAADNTVVSVKGKVSNIVNTSYGNFDLLDLEDSSKKIYVYGSTKDATKLDLTDSGNGFYTGKWYSGQNFKNACVEGDIITMNVVVTIYNSNPQIQGVITKVETATNVFIAKVKAFDLCNASAEELKAMLDEYDALIAKNADAANSAVDETTTLAERMAYMQLVYNKKANTTGESTSGVVITSNNSYDKTSLIALFAILGIVTISGYYIIEKKKFSK